MHTHKHNVMTSFGLSPDSSLSVREVARLSRIPVAALQEVYNRGIGAYKSNPTSVRTMGSFEKNPSLAAVPLSRRLPKEQWAMARVYSFVDKGTTYETADADIARRYGV